MVKDKVKEIVEGIGLHFVYDDWARSNVRLDREQLPACVFVLPASGQLYFKNNNFRDAPYCLLAFLDKTDFDFDGETNETTVDRMKIKAMKFIMAVQNSGMFDAITEEIDYTVAYDELDVNTTGVVISLRLKETVGICIDSL